MHRGVEARSNVSEDRAIRFKAALSLEFPASDINKLDWTNASDAQENAVKNGSLYSTGFPALLTVNFMGLTGPSGVLPLHYTELLIELRSRKDFAAQKFFDIFNDRLIWLLVRAWDKHRPHFAYERGEQESLMGYLLCFAGLGTKGLQKKLFGGAGGVKDEVIARYAGMLSRRPVAAATLAAVLTDYFRAPTTVISFQARFLTIPWADRSSLGKSNMVLGDSLVLGYRATDFQSKFLVEIGPLPRDKFNDLLPGKKGYAALVRLVRYAVGLGVEFDLRLVLAKRAMSKCVVSSAQGMSTQLGYDSWVTSVPIINDMRDAVFSVPPEGSVYKWRAA